MRNFTLLASALLLSTAAVASPSLVSVNTPHRATKIFGQSENVSAQMAGNRNLQGAHTTSIKLDQIRDAKAAGKKVKAKAGAPAKVAAPTEGIIDEVPAGTMTDWSRDCTGWFSFYGMIFYEPIYGCVQQMVETTDGDIYLNVQASEFPLDTWVKATKDADGNLTIAAGQKVYQEDYEDELYDFAMVPLTIDYDNEEFIYSDSYTLNYVDGKYVAADPEVIFGLCEYDPAEEAYYWTGYGDSEITLASVSGEIAKMPEGVASEKWAVVLDDGGYFVNVAIDGTTMYVQGLVPSAPEAVAVGTISDDPSVVTFKCGQFQGATENWTWAYLYGGTVEQEWDDEWEEFVDKVTPTGDLHFAYDAAGKKMVSQEAMLITANASDDLSVVQAVMYLADVTIEYQVRNPEAKPTNPTDVSYLDFYEDYGEGDFYFSIPEVDVEGCLLDPANLYYRVYVDGDPFTFYDDEYPMVSEEGQELIPANLYNYENIFSSGTAKCVYFYMEGIDEIGVQSVYMQPVEGGEPVELCSEIVSVQVSSVANAIADKAVSSSAYYDLQGRRVANPAAGLYIRRDVMTDGSVKAVKVAVK